MISRTVHAVVKNLSSVGIVYVAEWDSLAFLYFNGASLVSAQQIAGLIGHSKTAVAAALDSLMTKELVQRSRHSHGARLYQLADAAIGDFRRHCLEELMALAVERQGRPAIVSLCERLLEGKEMRGSDALNLRTHSA